MTKLCACGCGQRVTKLKNKYIIGHYWKGKHAWNYDKHMKRGVIKNE